MTSMHDLSFVLESVVARATDLLDASSGGMYLCEPEAQQVRCIVSYRTERDHTGTVLQYGEGAAGIVAQTGKPLIIPDYQVWPGRAKVYEEESPFAAVASAPMLWQDSVIGVLHVLRDKGDVPFTQDDLNLLILLASQASVALENARLVEVVEHRVGQLALINDFARAAMSKTNLNEMVAFIEEYVGDLINADGCFVSLWDEQLQTPISSESFSSMQQDYLQVSALPGEIALTQRALELGKPLVISDISNSPHLTPRMAAMLPMSSIIVMPLVVREQWLGATLIYFKAPHEFSHEEIALCEQVVGLVALALAKMRALEGERMRIRELEALRQASLSVTSRLELQPVLKAILTHTLKLISADDAHIFLYDGERLTFGAVKWVDDVERAPFSEPRQDGITYSVARGGERIIIPDVNKHPFFRDWQWGGAIIGLPLKIGERVVGVMNVAFSIPHEITEAELRALELLADQASIAIENARLFERSEAERGNVQLLYGLAQAVDSTLDPEEILRRAISLITKTLDGIEGVAFLSELGSDRLRVQASVREDGIPVQELDARIDMRLDKGLIGWVATNAEVALVSDVTTDERWLTIPGVDDDIRSAICVPILDGEKALGVMGVFHRKEDALKQEHLDLLVAASHQVGLALSNASRYQQIERRVTELSVLRQVAQVVNRRLEMQPLLEEIVHQVGEVLGYPVVEIYLVEEEGLVLGAALGLNDVTVRLPLTQGVIGRVVRTNKPAHVADVSQDPDYYAAWAECRSEIAIPLSKENVAIGVLNVESPVRGGLTEEDARLLSLLARNISIAVENAALYERLRQHAEELEHTVAERTAELADALEQAREADRLKTQFVSDVSHELRTPLSNILLYLELISSGNPDRFETYLETLSRETNRLMVLIEDLLAVSSMDAGTVTPVPSLIDLNLLTQGLVEDRRKLFAEKELWVDCKLCEDLPAVRADERMLSQVVANLMTNAMHYTPAGGRISICTALQHNWNEQWATLTVEDTGLGISIEEQGLIFKRFFRGAASRQTGTPGTGLGLAISKEIIERHGGKITMKSQIEQGSEFTIWLPLDETDVAQDQC
jgi:GAF domain-containing protein